MAVTVMAVTVMAVTVNAVTINDRPDTEGLIVTTDPIAILGRIFLRPASLSWAWCGRSTHI
ncbi:hypothetical protein CA13_44870 [Planctomycetes bacterium CA13]|uniref:Uncharacterized protein n=2 Tax=Novipirellula herctigrandis TaxID=2527986 RepID=A0A5C5Z6W2_9BACT|nr:hypothetical protein CA13_44870 [Planctomycetes bacterium CA13]